jgi:pilus assembly protein CpaF
VDAKLPRSEGMGGARVKILHPILVPGAGFPAINIRLFEPIPVLPEQLVAWGVAPEMVIQALVEAVSRQARVLVTGGTATGKTTILSALCSGIPKSARVVKIEDPEEIWLDHPHVLTIEARPAPPGSSVPPYTLRDGVDDAMRMSPRWLIVGEVRKGDAAMSLFRAQMSDHPGLSTFHAEGPEQAVFRLAVILFSDVGVQMQAAQAIFAEAIDLVVQVGWLDGRRQLLGIWEVERLLQAGNVHFRPLYKPGDGEMLPMHRR